VEELVLAVLLVLILVELLFVEVLQMEPAGKSAAGHANLDIVVLGEVALYQQEILTG
jgi:hypothetical protein